jgi:two-component system, OmpR family, copper resistance phosphate regulon response regulator CusR
MRLLIVEDEIGIANFLKQGLEEESFTVDIAHTGNEGLDLALSGSYDLIILDWMLPEKSGIEICTEFRKEYKSTPVIFLTAKDTVKETVHGLQIGANDYIKKPFHFEELLQRIRVQLRSDSSDKNEFSLGPIVLNVSSHSVHKMGEEISFTQKEFALLEFLLRNKGVVCSRTQIIENVWDIHFEYNTSVIDVFINSIRKKLNLDESENYIQTVRGVGYIAKEV